MTLLKSLPLPLGSPIIDFTLPGIDGKNHSLADYADRQVLVIIFMCNHCPYVQAVIERLILLQAGYKQEEVQFLGINSNDWDNYAEDSPKKMKEYAENWGLNFPYLYDESQETAKSYQAQCTPDMYVFAPANHHSALNPQNFSLRYHGRVDDNWQKPSLVGKQELKAAVDELLAGETPSEEQHPSLGCSIKWKAEKQPCNPSQGT